ncbi:hypothetical protein [Streptomyces sp. DH12]|uniref:hypothetical protein n=1 Tax=Streptomyces sp. DH12 TaxID=2857010 RepID=UPI001E63070B|nr:hypothetical protein [Streptomyces sp. DH12]
MDQHNASPQPFDGDRLTDILRMLDDIIPGPGPLRTAVVEILSEIQRLSCANDALQDRCDELTRELAADRFFSGPPSSETP